MLRSEEKNTESKLHDEEVKHDVKTKESLRPNSVSIAQDLTGAEARCFVLFFGYLILTVNLQFAEYLLPRLCSENMDVVSVAADGTVHPYSVADMECRETKQLGKDDSSRTDEGSVGEDDVEDNIPELI